MSVNERRYDIDWLRVCAMLAIFIFHCTRFFGTEGWHLKNPQQSNLVYTLTRGLIWPWVMELFFLLSGVGSWFTLQSKSGGRYIWGRFKRLLVPLYTVGLFILIPPQVYVDAVYNAGYPGTFWEFLPQYYRNLLETDVGIYPAVLNDPARLVPYTFSGHLWYLQYLFLVSLFTLPVLLFLKSNTGQRWIGRLAGWVSQPGGLFLFFIPLGLILVLARAYFSWSRTWADWIWYAAFFISGYVFASDHRFTKSIKRSGWFGLVLWLVSFFGVLLYMTSALGYNPTPGEEPFSLNFIIYQVVYSISSWCAVVFVLSMGAKYLNFNNQVLDYANEAILPFFLLHQTVILCVGWFVIPLEVGIVAKFMLIVVVSFSLIMAIYELLIRRYDPVRFFFGMSPKEKPPVSSTVRYG